MEDIFFLSKTRLSAEDIVEACKAAGIRRVDAFPDGVQAFYQEDQFWDWQFLSEEQGDLEGFEPRQRRTLLELQILTVIVVSFRHTSLSQLIPVLRVLMSMRGGWVASDDAAFETLYDAHRIGELGAALNGRTSQQPD